MTVHTSTTGCVSGRSITAQLPGTEIWRTGTTLPRPRHLLDGLDTGFLLSALIEPRVSERQPNMEVRRCVRQQISNYPLDRTEHPFYCGDKRIPSQRRERTWAGGLLPASPNRSKPGNVAGVVPRYPITRNPLARDRAGSRDRIRTTAPRPRARTLSRASAGPARTDGKEA